MEVLRVILTSLFFSSSYREEEERLRNKIRADHEKALEEAKEKLKKSREEIQAEIQTEKNKVVQEMKMKEKKPLPPVPIPDLSGISGGDPENDDIRKKREKIKEVIISWDLRYEVVIDIYFTGDTHSYAHLFAVLLWSCLWVIVVVHFPSRQ